jgi:hypothetical protein
MNHVAILAVIGALGVTPAADDNDVFVGKQRVFADLDSLSDGTQVWLQDVVVRAKNGNIVQVADHRHEIFVAPVDPSSLEFLTVGAHVDVRGTLRRTPSAAQARFIYAMGPATARRLARDQLFVATAYVTSGS